MWVSILGRNQLTRFVIQSARSKLGSHAQRQSPSDSYHTLRSECSATLSYSEAARRSCLDDGLTVSYFFRFAFGVELSFLQK